ncbi:MAG: hypothetical protein CMJ76_07985 [Planctomycetaceae bacterium]|nr:hypothetical protein [Planctomycetaceae bacterium]
MRLFNKSLAVLATATLVITSFSTAFADDDHYKGWTRSFEEAKELAAKEGKAILMEFTGSDWCPPCKALHKNVLSQEVFQTVKEDYILLVLDNPRDKSLVTPAEQQQYKQLSTKFQVRGVPSVFLADAEGRPFHFQSGYGGQKADQWVADIRAKKETLEKRDAAFARAEAAEGVEKAKALDEFISTINPQVAANFYKDSVDLIDQLDTEGVTSTKRWTSFETKFNELAAGNLDAEKLAAELNKLLEQTEPNPEKAQELIFKVSAGIFQKGNKPVAKVMLTAAQKLAPESSTGKRIPQILDQFFKN